MSQDKEKMTVTAADVGRIAVVVPKPIIEGVGTVRGPGESSVEPKGTAAAPSAKRRAELLTRHKELKAKMALDRVALDSLEAEISQIDARISVELKLCGLSQAERKILEDLLAEKVQKQLNENGK